VQSCREQMKGFYRQKPSYLFILLGWGSIFSHLPDDVIHISRSSDLFAGCCLLVSCLAYSSALNMEVIQSSEMLLDFV
jgi:hypothetical protein